jgi:hypothetical protein
MQFNSIGIIVYNKISDIYIYDKNYIYSGVKFKHRRINYNRFGIKIRKY